MAERRLFLDRRFVVRRDAADVVLGEGRRHPACPLRLDGESVWTEHVFYSSLFADGAGYRGWFWENWSDGGEEGPFVGVSSDDGITWAKTGEVLDNGRSLTILYDAREADPARRYKAVFQELLVPGDGGRLTPVLANEAHRVRATGGALVRRMLAMCSPDARSWPERYVIVKSPQTGDEASGLSGPPGWNGGDSLPCIFWAPSERKYVALFRSNIHSAPGGARERCVGRAESEDFVAWSVDEVAFRPNMPAQRAFGDRAHDYYQLQAWPCAGAYLGIVSVFYRDEDRVHLELAWSPDTRHWERVCPGQDLVPHGALGEPDGGCRYASMAPIAVGDDVRVYYGGSDGRHNADHNGRSALFLATFRRDRFAGLAPRGNDVGTVVTGAFPLSGSKIALNTAATRGEVRAELYDEDGAAIPGFGVSECVPVTTDALAAPLEWRGADSRQLHGRTVRLRLLLRNATVYALELN